MSEDNADAFQLRSVTPESYAAALELSVRDDQRGFVATVQKSLADAYVYREAVFRLAYVGDVPVGYLLLFPFDEGGKRHVNIVRLMIDSRHQGRGLGRRLLEAALDLIRTFEPRVEVVRISSRPDNEPALRLYRSAGFVERGIEAGEIALYLSIHRM